MINDFRKELDEREMISLIADLVNTPSYPGIPEQETGVAKLIHDFFVKEGIPSEIYEVVDGRCNVVARLEGHGKGKTLLLTGHTDTVPPYDMEDAFRMKIENEKLIGRGVVDMKGALACMVLSMAAIRRSGTRLKGNIMFAGVIGEEGKSEGTCALLKKGLKADAAIVGEPFGWNIGIGQKGLEWFECRILGKAVHGGKQKEGINAISKAGKLIRALDEELVPRIESRMHPIIGGSSMNYGMISGGFQPSTVAGECVLQFDRRWIPGEKYEDILREYDDFLERLGQDDPQFQAKLKVMDSSLMERGYIHEAMELSLEHPLVLLMDKTIFEATGHRAEKKAFPAWTDAGLLSSYGGIPTVIFGPGSPDSAHTAHEYLETSYLVPFTQIYALMARDFCQ
ncbi:MAG: M20 family metallopeptidase [Thermovirgaceae bacterium]|jgi:acetylornithine deacetylase/succinyl-diaminopimelate desuccinylase|nr:M20 family metallopeptidase [Synergistales bacterium]MDD5515427.1 M20 family metallopeptidase [Synergistales bacterium]MDI9393683.1 M20 family metallopeptidase [Synergistota bacterium]MDY0179540.1 M20 family metallopeptidase [Synergistaceae bacterium]